MLYRHVFDKISTEFCGILRVFVNFEALRPARNIRSPDCVIYKLATKTLHLATIFLQLVAKRRLEDFFNFEPWRRSATSRYHGSMDLFLDDKKTSDDGKAERQKIICLY